MIRVRVIPQDNPNFVVLEGFDDASDCPTYRVSVSCAALAEGTLTVADEAQAVLDRMTQRVDRWTQAKSALSQIKS